MDYAIQLANMVQGQTGVNPPVGAVVVKEGRIVGIGAHLRKGDKHAEVQALDMAQQNAEGATIYITLEPCSHFGSTPPCVNKIIDCKIAKVVYATKDNSLDTHGDETLRITVLRLNALMMNVHHNYTKTFLKQKQSNCHKLQ